jgi:hypothetical protein
MIQNAAIYTESEMRYTKLHSMPAQMDTIFCPTAYSCGRTPQCSEDVVMAAFDESNWKLHCRTRA